MILTFAKWLVSCPNEDLNPRTVAPRAANINTETVCYMLAHERHRRGLPVRMVRG